MHVGELRNHAGVVLDSIVIVEPDSVASLDAGESLRLSITVTPGGCAAPGDYHGLVFVEGLAEPPLLLIVEIESQGVEP